jgi:hypothetical protein
MTPSSRRSSESSKETLEDPFRATEGDIALLADLFELSTVTVEPALSAEGCAALMSLCRRRVRDLQDARHRLASDVLNLVIR